MMYPTGRAMRTAVLSICFAGIGFGCAFAQDNVDDVARSKAEEANRGVSTVVSDIEALERRVTDLENGGVVDTNAGTICQSGEVLDGDGVCVPLPIDTDTNAATLCATGEVLAGGGICLPYTALAGQLCPTGEFMVGVSAEGAIVCAAPGGGDGGGDGGGGPVLACATADCAAEIAAECADTGDFAERITCAHNVVRANASPLPVDPLPVMSYSPDLAMVAQEWAETCTFAHNADRAARYTELTGNIEFIGENLYFRSSVIDPLQLAELAVGAWAAEQADYDIYVNDCADGAVCGHYTQVVWEETTMLGCGFSTSCGEFTGFDTHLVCNYATAGNFSGQTPYEPVAP